MRFIYLLLLTFTSSFALTFPITYDVCNNDSVWDATVGKSYLLTPNEFGYVENQDILYSTAEPDLIVNSDVSIPFMTKVGAGYTMVETVTHLVDGRIQVSGKRIDCNPMPTECQAGATKVGAYGWTWCEWNSSLINPTPSMPEPERCTDNEYLDGLICKPKPYVSVPYYVSNITEENWINSYCNSGSADGLQFHDITLSVPTDFMGVHYEKKEFRSLSDNRLLSIPFISKEISRGSVTFVNKVTPVSGENKIILNMGQFTCTNCNSNGYKENGSCIDDTSDLPNEIIPYDGKIPPDDWEITSQQTFDGITINCVDWRECVDYNAFGVTGTQLGGFGAITKYSFKNIRPVGDKFQATMIKTHVNIENVGPKDENPNDNLEPCPDGAPRSFGSCDRRCEDVGYISTRSEGSVLNPNYEVMCLPALCPTSNERCLAKCGTLENILANECNVETNEEICQCVDDVPEDPIIDPNDPLEDDKTNTNNQDDETVDDTALTNDGKQAKNDSLKTNKLLGSIDDKLLEGFNGVGEKLDASHDSLLDIEFNTANMDSNLEELLDLEKERDEQAKEDKNTIESLIDDFNYDKDYAESENENIRSDIESKGEGIIDNIDNVISTIQSGFTFNPPPVASVSHKANIKGQEIDFSMCTTLSHFSFLISLFIQISLYIASIRIIYGGFLLIRK